MQMPKAGNVSTRGQWNGLQGSLPRTRKVVCSAGVAAMALSLAGASGAAHPVENTSEAACAALVDLPIANTRIVETNWVAATEEGPMPEHCEIVGAINERTGSDGKPYAIGFRLRLPAEWNGRFLFEGGGGVDGVLRDALGSFGPPQEDDNPLSHGYAVVQTDSGHRIEDIPVVGAVTFGLEPQARIEYGYQAIYEVTGVAKELVEAFYGTPARNSYFVGCSNGGRQAFQASQRFPDLFDGVVAGAPGFNAPEAVINQLWYLNAWADAATERDAGGFPYLATALSAQEQQLIGDAILRSCDANDGLVDGIIDDVVGCQFDPAVLQCAPGQTEDCLSTAQVGALSRHMAGPVNSRGERIAVDWPWDAGISAPGWRGRPLGTPNPQKVNSASAIYLGSAAAAYLFSTPPETPGLNAADPAAARRELSEYVFGYDFDTQPAAIYAKNEEFGLSAVEYDTADSVELSAFKASGGKMIIYHGGSDPSWSMNDTLRWYNNLEEVDPAARDFARLFVVPGMNHCSGGPATEKADFLTALVNWVEYDQAPDRIVGEAKDEDDVPWPGRTRPFCPYPLQARYTGTGSIELAENFVCEQP